MAESSSRPPQSSNLHSVGGPGLPVLMKTLEKEVCGSVMSYLRGSFAGDQCCLRKDLIQTPRPGGQQSPEKCPWNWRDSTSQCVSVFWEMFLEVVAWNLRLMELSARVLVSVYNKY